jgi:mannose-6-phosphate isomerase-like protein (cupin superfamily)
VGEQDRLPKEVGVCLSVPVGVSRVEEEQKAWGTARHVFATPYCAVSVLKTEDGGFCSRHIHKERVNRFLVVSGSIDVVTYTPSGKFEISRDRLNPGDMRDVNAWVVHSFEVVEPGIVVEVYWPSAEVRLDDIQRITLGGKTKTIKADEFEHKKDDRG